MDDFLKVLGLSYDRLTQDEKAVYWSMLEKIEQRPLTVDDFKQAINSLKQAIEHELTKTPDKLSKDERLFLTARLRNALLLEAFFETPEKAKKMAMQQMEFTKRVRAKEA